MKSLIKNIDKAKALTLKDEVEYRDGQVVSKTLTQNDYVSITLFSFDKGEGISTHESGGDAFVTCLDGVGKITVDGTDYTLTEGQSIVMPAKHPQRCTDRNVLRCCSSWCFNRRLPKIRND